MIGRSSPYRVASLSVCAAFTGLVLAQTVSAQEPQRHPDEVAPAAASTQVPGVLDALGRLVDQSLATIGLKDTGPVKDLGERAGEAAKDAATTAKDAAETVVRLPATRIVSGRQRCEPAANGAPDCQTAANAVCRSKGFGSGRSVDIESAHKCPAHVWLSRRSPTEGECSLETFVTRVMCQ